jgi:ribosomal protein S17E
MVSLALGYLSSMMMDATGDDDEEDGVNTSKYARLPEHVKSNNVAIPFVGDTYIQLPTRGMWQSFTNLGTLIYDFQTGRKDAEEVVAGFTTSMRDAVDFIGGNAPTAGQWLAPTIFDPLVQVLEGKDWAGREIYRKDFGQGGANAHRGKNATGSLYKMLAEGLNSATGGDKVKSGLVDLYPETYQLFTEFMLGSLAQLALNDVPNTLQTVAGAREAKANDIPAIGGVLRQSSDVESQYYTEFAKFDKVYKELKGYRKERMTAKTAEERQKWRDREQALIAKYPWARSADTLNAIAGRITKLKKQTNERNEASIDAQIEKQAKNFLRFIQKGQ